MPEEPERWVTERRNRCSVIHLLHLLRLVLDDLALLEADEKRRPLPRVMVLANQCERLLPPVGRLKVDCDGGRGEPPFHLGVPWSVRRRNTSRPHIGMELGGVPAQEGP